MHVPDHAAGCTCHWCLNTEGYQILLDNRVINFTAYLRGEEPFGSAPVRSELPYIGPRLGLPGITFIAKDPPENDNSQGAPGQTSQAKCPNCPGNVEMRRGKPVVPKGKQLHK